MKPVCFDFAKSFSESTIDIKFCKCFQIVGPIPINYVFFFFYWKEINISPIYVQIRDNHVVVIWKIKLR